MRKNYTYIAEIPNDRNEFIDMITSKKEVIVVDNELLKELTKEINSNISDKKHGKFLKKASIPMAILSWSNPIGWVCSGIVLLCGIFSSASDDFKKYVIYSGTDNCNNQILIFHHKNEVNLNYDEVIYPDWVKGVNTKKTNKKVKIKK